MFILHGLYDVNLVNSLLTVVPLSHHSVVSGGRVVYHRVPLCTVNSLLTVVPLSHRSVVSGGRVVYHRVPPCTGRGRS